MSDDSDFVFSDDDINEDQHNKIVEDVLSLNKSQQLKKPSRTEAALHISEFNLVKSVTGHKGTVHIDDLASVLKTRKKHVEISKKVESTKKKGHTLPKPLEKPQAERIKRSVGYEKNRFLLDRWEAFVTSNRAQAHQSFPLGGVEKLKVEGKKAATFLSTLTYKSKLQKELEKVDEEIVEYQIKDNVDENEFPLSLEDLKNDRKELAKLRALQSYKEAKARRQNKIKSKAYHRILRKEKIKKKLKEFEELQKTNPEEALKKLEEIEKARALERFSLRHKSTGQWAKSKQVRAKYDKESRQVLAQQLQISRDLAQKQKVNSDSEDEVDAIEPEVIDSSELASKIPWIGGTQTRPSEEVITFLNEFAEFAVDDNAVIGLDTSKKTESASKLLSSEKTENVVVVGNDNIGVLNADKNFNNVKNVDNTTEKKNKTRKKKGNLDPIKISSKDSMPTALHSASGVFDIEDLFSEAAKKLEKKLKTKLLKNQKQKSGKIMKNNKSKKTRTKKADLTIPSQSKKQIIDEEMIEQPQSLVQDTQSNDSISALKSILKTDAKHAKSTDVKQTAKPTVTNLDSFHPDIIVLEENVEEDSQSKFISEGFEDLGIAEDFLKEKKSELEKDKPGDIDLNLPGWGSWAGSGINPKKQKKRRRFIFKMPKIMPRRDDNKGALIINEKAAKKVKPYLVSDIPFPFKTVKDYEASIRSPIGNSFVPELAYRSFIKPAVETKLGTIIEPATTSILMGKPNK